MRVEICITCLLLRKMVTNVKGFMISQTWHDILGRCNHEDVQKLQSVVKGMEIKGNPAGPDHLCEVCTQGKIPSNKKQRTR